MDYLTFDSAQAGVGTSQVVPYVTRIAQRGVDVTLHSFEPEPPRPETENLLAACGVAWHPQRFGRGGSWGGLARVLRAAPHVRGSPLVHARTELAAAATMIARSESWVWDVRSFWAEERMATGALRRRSPEVAVLAFVERCAAARSSAVVTLSQAAVDVLVERYGSEIAEKSTVIPTCVDLDRFAHSPPPQAEPVVMLMSGSLNRGYDVPTMLRLSTLMNARRSTVVRVASTSSTPWDEHFAEEGLVPTTVSFADMPAEIRYSHIGLSLRHVDSGVSLRAAMPTKVAEFLAVGRPVVVNSGLGDFDALLRDYDCGAVLADRSDDSLDQAVAHLERLLDDRETSTRCRKLAEQHFDLDVGVDRLLDIYARVVR